MSGFNFRDLFVTVRASSIEDEDDEDEYEEHNPEDQNDYPSIHQWFPPVKEAQKEGEELLYSGDFGRVGIKIKTRANNSNLVKSVLNRAAQPIPNLNKEDLLSVCFNFLIKIMN